MTDVYDEDDLRAALATISEDVPSVQDVLPCRSDARARRWLAPLAVAALVLAVAVGIAVVRHASHRAPAGDNASRLVGHSWMLVRIGDEPTLSALPLFVGPNGRLTQRLADCDALIARVRVGLSELHVVDRSLAAGKCTLDSRAGDALNAQVTHLLAGRVTWSIEGSRLTLSKQTQPSLVYVRIPHSFKGARTYTDHGVGVIVPRSWLARTSGCGVFAGQTVLASRGLLRCFAAPNSLGAAIELEKTKVCCYLHQAHPLPTVSIDGVPVTETISSVGAGNTRIDLSIPSRGVTLVIVSGRRTSAVSLERAVYLTHP